MRQAVPVSGRAWNASIRCGFSVRLRRDSYRFCGKGFLGISARQLQTPGRRCQSFLQTPPCWENRSHITAGGELSGREPQRVQRTADEGDEF